MTRIAITPAAFEANRQDVTSEATASPTKLREACEEVAKRLRTATAEARKGGAARRLFDWVLQATTQ